MFDNYAIALFVFIGCSMASTEVPVMPDGLDSLNVSKVLNGNQSSVQAPMDKNPEIPDWVATWKAPEAVRDMFPFYLTGYDLEGSPVYVLPYGQWKVAEGFNNYEGGPDDAKTVFSKYTDWVIYQLYQDGLKNDVQGIGIIADFDGFRLSHYGSAAAIQMITRQLSGLNRIYKVLNYAYFINTNFAAETLMAVARPLMGNFLEKCEVLGNQKAKWFAVLSRKIPASELPPSYGGPADWAPVSFGSGR